MQYVIEYADRAPGQALAQLFRKTHHSTMVMEVLQLGSAVDASL